MELDYLKQLLEICKHYNVSNINITENGAVSVRLGPPPAPDKTAGEMKEEEELARMLDENLPWLGSGVKARRIK